MNISFTRLYINWNLIGNIFIWPWNQAPIFQALRTFIVCNILPCTIQSYPLQFKTQSLYFRIILIILLFYDLKLGWVLSLVLSEVLVFASLVTCPYIRLAKSIALLYSAFVSRREWGFDGFVDTLSSNTPVVQHTCPFIVNQSCSSEG